MMPKEQPGSDVSSSSASSTKNAKDKSNSSTMQALRSAADNRTSCSEKDSGYSDTSSDWKHSNVKDRSNRKSRESTDALPLNQNDSKNSSYGNAVMSPPTGQLGSFYIIKNMVLEQPRIVQKNGQLLWSSGASSNVPASNPVLLLQSPNMLPPTLLPRPPGKTNSTMKTTQSTNHLPIPNPYTRISPHPHKKPPDKTALTSESDNHSKRVCIESKSAQVNVSPQVQCIQKISTSKNVASSNSPTVSTTQSSELNKSSIINTRHIHFVSTMQILKESGLLDITLRTKELMRQSNATGRDLAQLRQHSDLLCQIASSSSQNPSNVEEWFKLHKYMAESGSYPNLKDIQALQVPATTQQHEGADRDEPLVSPNNLKDPKQMDATREIEPETRPESQV